MHDIPEQAVQAMPERIFLGFADADNEHQVWTDEGEGGTEYVRADLAAPNLAAVRVNSDQIEAARKAVEELANTQMNLPLEDWSRISSAILSALEPSAGRAAGLEEGYRQGIKAAAKLIECGCKDLLHGKGECQFPGNCSLEDAAAIRALASHPVADKPDEAGAQGEVKPVAYLRPKDIERLAAPGVSGAINVQIANTPFIGCTVPVFAALPTPPSSEVA